MEDSYRKAQESINQLKYELMKAQLIKLWLTCCFIASPAFLSAQSIVKSADFSTKVLETICKSAGIQVLETEANYIKVKLPDSLLDLPCYLDLSQEKDYILINKQMPLIADAPITKIKDLVVNINTNTNFVKAGYDSSKSQIDFRYYFWIKDGFTEKSLISALAMFKLTFMYGVSLDTENLLK